MNYEAPKIEKQSKDIMTGNTGRFIVAIFLIAIGYFIGVTKDREDISYDQPLTEEQIYTGEITSKYGEAPEWMGKDVDFKLFWDVWDTIKKDYVDKDKIKEKELFYGAIQGMVGAVGDPYTVFMDPKISQEFQNDLAGTFEGIGAEVGIRDDVLTIIAPLDEMPAQKAGILAGDKILAIDGEPTLDLSIDEAVSKMRGEKGTDVKLTVFREGDEATKDITITRGIIYVKSVKTEVRPDGLYVVKITNFNGDTLDLFNEAVRDIIAKNPKGVIVDLRNNSGGYLETSIEVASEWIEDGVVVIEQQADGSKKEYRSRGRARLKDFPTVILINQGSASASEILAGALKENGKAVLVGEKSYGKGSVQNMTEFSDGSSVKITIAKWLTPNGLSINEEGISPDNEVKLDIEAYIKEDKDAQMDMAVELLLADTSSL